MSVRFSVEEGIAEVLLDHPPVNALDSTGWTKARRDHRFSRER